MDWRMPEDRGFGHISRENNKFVEYGLYWIRKNGIGGIKSIILE
jgi:hypothetical protein